MLLLCLQTLCFASTDQATEVMGPGGTALHTCLKVHLLNQVQFVERDAYGDNSAFVLLLFAQSIASISIFLSWSNS